MSQEKKRGRPTKAAAPGERVSLGLRVTAEMKARLDTAAMKNGRSQSQEAEYRLERSFADEALFPSPEMRFWAVFMASKFHSSGSRMAAEQAHPEWSDAQWMQDPTCFQAAAFEVMGFLLIETLKQSGADAEDIALRLESLRARGATYLANTGKLGSLTGKEKDDAR